MVRVVRTKHRSAFGVCLLGFLVVACNSIKTFKLSLVKKIKEVQLKTTVRITGISPDFVKKELPNELDGAGL